MNEIKCPKCGTVFQISETDYESIAKQIKDKEFEKEIQRREEQFNSEKESALKILEAHIREELMQSINEKDAQIKDLKNEISLQNMQKDLDVQKAVSDKEKEIMNLNQEIQLSNKEFMLKEKNIKESYEGKLKDKDAQIEFYRDLKARQSTKMVGESLEQHCSIEFNRIRPLFQNAYFEKDNDARSGSKGDFIFRDYDEDHNEIVSIMFEMKNETDTTSTKHKNEDFFKELDKDRKEKKCEYAVLVSLLEPDNDYYNDGIVDVSYRYEKMYVIRPQFFVPLITLIRNLANKSLQYRKELELIRNQNIDITNFEEKLGEFKEGFDRNCVLAGNHFKKAIEEIDKTIEHLQKTKESLLKTTDNLKLANNKVEDLTVRKLTYNNPTMTEMFKNAKEIKEEEIKKLEAPKTSKKKTQSKKK